MLKRCPDCHRILLDHNFRFYCPCCGSDLKKNCYDLKGLANKKREEVFFGVILAVFFVLSMLTVVSFFTK
jgi:hypothetical protein